MTYMIESRGLYMEINESGLSFVFGNGTTAYKFDDDLFYRKEFNNLPGSKGVDIIVSSKQCIQMIEIKNCKGNEQDNIWRIKPDNKNVIRLPSDNHNCGRDSLDIEVAQKISMTISCLYGASTMRNTKETADKLRKYWSRIDTEDISKDKKQLIVTLFLEGDFNGYYKTRDKKMIMTALQRSIRHKLSWLNCKVSVVDSDTYNRSYYEVKEIKEK